MSERVRDVGEFALIERLLAVLPEKVRGTDTVFGAGDDCAWWPNMPGSTVVTSDALVEDLHFRLDWTDWRSLGHKMLAVNLSDLASMGSTPNVAIVTLALTGNERVNDLEDLYRGAGELAAIYGVVVAGGDIVSTSGPVMLSVTAMGQLDAGRTPMLRSQAQPGDVVVVSGTLGASAAGLRLLEQGGSDAATADLLIGSHLRPAPRVSLGQALLHAGVRCCMDLSDGLAGDLPKILEASGVGAVVDLNALPVLPAVRALFADDWLSLAMRGGEDYELLCTIPPAMLDDVTRAAADVGATLTVIGEIDAGSGMWTVESGDIAKQYEPGAWDHFRHNEHADS